MISELDGDCRNSIRRSPEIDVVQERTSHGPDAQRQCAMVIEVAATFLAGRKLSVTCGLSNQEAEAARAWSLCARIGRVSVDTIGVKAKTDIVCCPIAVEVAEDRLQERYGPFHRGRPAGRR